MEQAMAYVCCPAEESRVKVQRYCRKIYELGYVPICPRFGFLPFLDEGEAEDQQAYNRTDEPEMIEAKYQEIQELYPQIGFCIGKNLFGLLTK